MINLFFLYFSNIFADAGRDRFRKLNSYVSLSVQEETNTKIFFEDFFCCYILEKTFSCTKQVKTIGKTKFQLTVQESDS